MKNKREFLIFWNEFELISRLIRRILIDRRMIEIAECDSVVCVRVAARHQYSKKYLLKLTTVSLRFVHK